MPALSAPKDEAFAQGIASGLSHAEAWRKATGKTNNADVNCDKLLGKAGIKERIAELKGPDFGPRPHLVAGADNRVPVQCHQHLRRQCRSGLFARAISGVRGRQTREAPNPRQDRGGEGTDQDMRLGGAESHRTVGDRHAGGVY